MENNHEWIWSPGKSVGIIMLGRPAKTIIDSFNLKKHVYHDDYLIDKEKFEGDEIFESENDMFNILAIDGIIGSITCNQFFFYKDTNLIGLNEQQGKLLLGRNNPNIDYEEGGGHWLEFDDLGLMLWVEDRVIKSCICECID